jgi:N4-gp56 family major capsid protein
VNPDWQSISYSDVSGTFEERVEIYAATSRTMVLAEDDTIKANVDQLKDKCMRIRTAVGWSKWLAGTNVLYNNAAVSARTGVNGTISTGLIQEAIRILDDAKAMTFTEVDNGGLNNGTIGLEGAYIAFAHTNLLPDIRRLDGFTKVSEYGSAQAISKFERGAMEAVRFLMSPELTPFLGGGATATGLNLKATDVSGTDKVDVYPVLVCGKHALGCADLKGVGQKGWGGCKVEILDKADKADPANLNTLFVAHWFDLQLILNDAWVVRIEVGATSDLTQL